MRRIGLVLGWLAVAVVVHAAPLAVRAVDAVGITVSDADRSVDFYSRVLGFVPEADVEVAGPSWEGLWDVFPVRARAVRLRLGGEALELIEYVTPRGRPAPADMRSNDRWFQHVAIVVSDMDRAYGWLRDQRVAHVSPSPQRLPDWNPNAGGIRAFYFRDPDGHPLELIQFPPGKGDPRWQDAGDRLFLGIDHTAIAVADTARSLAFYRDRLGFRVAGRSLNHGDEQARLNAVRGARVRITSLRADAGPGIELLEYLTPRDGRPFPRDARPNDLLHWRTRLLAGPGVRLEAAGPRPVTVAPPALGFGRAVALRDPDGHTLEVVQP
jgi:catechol 2,3-dioxygenase-like lactoylglutathione lyase family enzyme